MIVCLIGCNDFFQVRESLTHSINIFDGLTLAEAMHVRGINIRYLGKVAQLVAQYETLDYLMVCLVSLFTNLMF